MFCYPYWVLEEAILVSDSPNRITLKPMALTLSHINLDTVKDGKVTLSMNILVLGGAMFFNIEWDCANI